MDMNRLREITDGDLALEQHLFGLFIETADRVIARLDSLVSDHSGHWQRAAHELKGVCANMHIEVMLRQCQKIETLADAESRRAGLDQLRQAYQPIRAELLAAIQPPQ